MTEKQELASKLTKELCNIGKIIEGGFVGFKIMVYSSELPARQEEDLRNAFFAGAQHLFGSIMNVMDSDREPTANDLKVMDNISKELQAFIEEFELKYTKPQGNA